mgnify:FL=1
MEEALEVLETEDSYDGYFYRIKDAVVIVILGSLCELQNVKKIHTWATSVQVRTFLSEHFNITRIPCYWWLLSLLAMIKSESLNECMKQWVASEAPSLLSKIEVQEDEQRKKKRKRKIPLSFDNKWC